VTISPIEERYGRPEVRAIFEQQNHLNCMLKIEISVAESQIKYKIIPHFSLDKLKYVLKEGVDIKKMKSIESEIKHDTMAFIRTVDEQSQNSFPFLHFGLTSNDVSDSATALQIKDFYNFLMDDLKEIQGSIISLVRKYKGTPMLGRTHGQHASPITFGLKFATYLEEFNRHYIRALQVQERILVGKALGPVGTGASMGEKAIKVSEDAMNSIGLKSELATGQLVARDRYVEFLQFISNMAVTCEKIGTEIRNLQRPEIGEVMEFFDKSRQVGSSSMPSKRNPIETENVCSIARIIRSMVTPEMEAAVTWHERDLTNSALERFTIPYSCILIDYILVKLSRIIKNLYVDEGRMAKNLLESPLCISENLTTMLTLKNIDRQESHEIIRKISMEYYEGKKSLMEILSKSEFSKLYTFEEIEKGIDPKNFTGLSENICDAVIEKTENIRKG
jgi:adenylosuccinate lyase